MTKRTRAVRSSSMRTLEADGKTLVKYCLDSSKYYHTYKFLKRLEKDEAKDRLLFLTKSVDPDVTKSFYEELEYCLKAAISDETIVSPTQVFFQYVIDLIEMYYSNELFSIQSEELEDYSYEKESSFFISDDVLDDYERSLIYEYYVLGYTPTEIGKKKLSDADVVYKKITRAIAKLQD
jgi:hypothetical protein